MHSKIEAGVRHHQRPGQSQCNHPFFSFRKEENYQKSKRHGIGSMCRRETILSSKVAGTIRFLYQMYLFRNSLRVRRAKTAHAVLHQIARLVRQGNRDGKNSKHHPTLSPVHPEYPKDDKQKEGEPKPAFRQKIHHWISPRCMQAVKEQKQFRIELD